MWNTIVSGNQAAAGAGIQVTFWASKVLREGPPFSAQRCPLTCSSLRHTCRSLLKFSTIHH